MEALFIGLSEVRVLSAGRIIKCVHQRYVVAINLYWSELSASTSLMIDGDGRQI